MRTAFLAAVILSLLVTPNVSAQQETPWTPLFNEKSLAGWERLNGTATYAVEDGVIVGTTSPGSPNSFLCTTKQFGNFILELDFKVDEGLNSGVQIRSESTPEYMNGRVHGYQVEIDPAQKEMYSATPSNLRADGTPVPPGTEPRRWTGGIYDEGRRKWLYDLSRSETARAAFLPDAWNHLRVEAVGSGIRTWINGVFTSGIVDAMTPNGFIGLQVHAVKGNAKLQARWKNIRIQDLGFNDALPEMEKDTLAGDWISAATGPVARVSRMPDGSCRIIFLRAFDAVEEPFAVLADTSGNKDQTFRGGNAFASFVGDRLKGELGGKTFDLRRIRRPSPTLNAPPPKNAVILFDGRNTDEWAKQKPKEWLVEDGPATAWKIIPGGTLEVVPKAGSVITKREFGDFHLHAEFRLLGEPTNGGIYLMSRYEVNIKDSYGQASGDPCAAPGNIAEPKMSSPIVNAAAPPMQWQTLDIDFVAPRFDAQGTRTAPASISVALNGVSLYKNVQPEKLKGAATRLGEAVRGPLMLQEHGTAYQFRNIWLVESTGTK